MNNEVWKDIPAHEGVYQASSLGRIKNLKPLRGNGFLSLLCDSHGYLYVHLRCEGRQKKHSVHRLVAAAFIGLDDRQINHKNGVKDDNRPENLEYVTASENMRHAFNMGLIPPRSGEANGNSKLNAFQVADIRRRRESGEFLRVIASDYGINPGTVWSIATGKNWRSVAL